MQKENLTVEYCKKEIAPPYRNSFQPIHLVNCILAAVGAFLLGAFFAGLSGENGKMVVTIFSIVGCLPLLIYLYIQFTAPRDAKEREERVAKRELIFVEDVLEKAYQESPGGKHQTMVYILKFRDHGKYVIPGGQHYTWSELYSMSGYGIYNTAVSGDTFYLAVWKEDPRQTPILVYNAKFFELCEEGTKPRSGKSWRDSVNLE